MPAAAAPSPPLALLLLVLAALTLLALAALLFLRRRRPDPYPYEPQEALFTPAERDFLQTLDAALGDQYRIFGKVRIADVLRVREGLPPAQRMPAFNRIQGKHLDFIVCDPRDLSVVCAIELDDASHDRADRRRRDAFVEAALEAAGLPLYRFPVRRWSIAELQEAFRHPPQ